MSIKSMVLAAAATLTVAGGLSTAGTLSASAAFITVAVVKAVRVCLSAAGVSVTATPLILFSSWTRSACGWGRVG
jgi:hypothetical protein